MLCGKSCGRFWFGMALPLLFASHKLQYSLTDSLLKLHIASTSVWRAVYLVTPTPALMCVWHRTDHKAVVHDWLSAALQRSAGIRVVCWAVLGMHSPRGSRCASAAGHAWAMLWMWFPLQAQPKHFSFFQSSANACRRGRRRAEELGGRLAGETEAVGGCIFVALLSWVPMVGF